MARFTDDELMRKVQEGFIVESEADMTETYKKALITQLTVQGDTELMSAPAYYMATKDAPSTNTMVSATAIIQDEMGHANIAYRLLEDLGVDRDELLYERPPEKFKNPYGFDQPLENWAELVVANGLYDRAGITLLGDVHRNTSYGPLKRGLVKVGMEENFHLRWLAPGRRAFQFWRGFLRRGRDFFRLRRCWLCRGLLCIGRNSWNQ